MSTSIGKLTVFFEEPFWVGVFERIENGKLSVSKVTFGAEPKDYEKILTYNVNEPLVTPSFSKSDDAAIQYHTSSPLVELPMYFSCFNLLLML